MMIISICTADSVWKTPDVKRLHLKTKNSDRYLVPQMRLTGLYLKLICADAPHFTRTFHHKKGKAWPDF